MFYSDRPTDDAIKGPADILVDAPDQSEPVGSVEFDLGESYPQVIDHQDPEEHYSNLALFMDPGALTAVSDELLRLIDQDIQGRKAWEEMCISSMQILGLTLEERSEPFKGASGMFHPMLLDAVIRFQSETIREICPGGNWCKTKINGAWTEEKQKQSDKVGNYLNELLTQKMRYWRRDKEHSLFTLGLRGAAFSKVYWDFDQAKTVVDAIEPQDFIVPYGMTNLETCPRYTHWMRKTTHDIRRLQIKGIYRDIQITPQYLQRGKVETQESRFFGYQPMGANEDFVELYECHALLDIFEDADEDGLPTGLARPYIVTMEKSTGEVLGLYRNWAEDDPSFKKRKYFISYQLVPAFGPYGLGLAHVLGNLSKAATIAYRQLLDAGTLANFPGGYKNAALKIRHDTTPHRPGEWREATIDPTIQLQNCFFKLPYGEPSATLHQLVQEIVETGRRSAVNAEVGVSDLGGNQDVPVGTVLALLERTLKTITAIQARVHESVGEEFCLIAETEALFNKRIVLTGDSDIREESVIEYDPEVVGIVPVSDPNSSTLAQRMLQMQALLGIVAQHPEAFNKKEVARQYLYALGFQNVDELLNEDDKAEHADPVLENMCLVTGKPVKAFLDQDHDSHITVHQSFMNDPLIQGQVGQFQQAPAMMAAMQAHVCEHVAFAYRKRLQEQLGSEIPKDLSKSPEAQDSLAPLMARAAGQTLDQDKAQAAQAESAQQAQDPVFQQQQREQALAEQKEKHREQMDQQKLALDQQKEQDSKAIELAKLDQQKRQWAFDQLTNPGGV